MVVVQGMGLALVGVVIGLGARVRPGAADHDVPVRRHRPDPLVFVGVPVLLAVVALRRGVAARAARQPGRSDHRAQI